MPFKPVRFLLFIPSSFTHHVSVRGYNTSCCLHRTGGIRCPRKFLPVTLIDHWDSYCLHSLECSRSSLEKRYVDGARLS